MSVVWISNRISLFELVYFNILYQSNTCTDQCLNGKVVPGRFFFSKSQKYYLQIWSDRYTMKTLLANCASQIVSLWTPPFVPWRFLIWFMFRNVLSVRWNSNRFPLGFTHEFMFLYKRWLSSWFYVLHRKTSGLLRGWKWARHQDDVGQVSNLGII